MRKLDLSRLKTTEPVGSDVLTFFSNTLYNANSSVSGVVKLVDSTSNSSATVAASANSVKAAYELAFNADNGLSSAYSNATSYADTKAAAAYSNAIAYAASNTYVNSTFASNTYINNTFASNSYVNSSLAYHMQVLAPQADPTFTGNASFAVVAVSGNATFSGSMTVGGVTTITGNLVANSTLSAGNTTISGSVLANTVYIGNTAANVTANSSMVRVSANATLHASLGANGVMINGSYGTNGYLLKSTGTGQLWTTISKYDVALGNVQNVDQQNATNLTYGTVATERLGSGTANSITFLRGDQSYARPALDALANVSISSPADGQPLVYTGTTVTIGGTYTVGTTPGVTTVGWNKNSNTVAYTISNTEVLSLLTVGSAITLYWNAGANSVTTTIETISPGYSFDIATQNLTGAAIDVTSFILPTANSTTYSWQNSNTVYAVANGNVGIGNTTPTNKLSVGGNTYVYGSVLVTGDLYTNYSDARLKIKLGDIEDALDIIDSIETMYYEPNQLALDLGATSGRKVGVSAQSVQLRAPEAVGISPMGDQYLTVQYERLVPYLVAAVKHLRAQVEELRGQK